MSNQTWMVEFYPTYASATLPDEAAAHSLRKWEGLIPSNLAKHDITSSPVNVTACTCALCYHYSKVEGGKDCRDCPIVAVRGRPCDEELDDENLSPWHRWSTKRDPMPMIRLLREVCGED